MSEYGGQLVSKAKILEILARAAQDVASLPNDQQFTLVEAGATLTFDREIQHVSIGRRLVVDAPVSCTATFRLEFSHHAAGT